MKYTFNITYKRNWQADRDGTSVAVVGRHVDEALDRFWVWKWKNGRDRRNEVTVLSVQRLGAIVV